METEPKQDMCLFFLNCLPHEQIQQGNVGKQKTFERPRAREANREHPGNDKHPKITLMCHSFKFSQVCASIILCEIKQTEKTTRHL